MANKGFSGVRVWVGDVPNIGSATSSSSNKPAIWRETAVLDIITNYMEFSHNCFGIRVLNCDKILITQGKLGAVWRESNLGTIVCGGDLVTIDIPLPDFFVRYGYDVLRVYGREANMEYSILLPYGMKVFPCLSIPQTNCLIPRS